MNLRKTAVVKYAVETVPVLICAVIAFGLIVAIPIRFGINVSDQDDPMAMRHLIVAGIFILAAVVIAGCASLRRRTHIRS